jgi:hypothetical protein
MNLRLGHLMDRLVVYRKPLISKSTPRTVCRAILESKDQRFRLMFVGCEQRKIQHHSFYVCARAGVFLTPG